MCLRRKNTSESNCAILTNNTTANHIIHFAGNVIETTVTNKAQVTKAWIHEIYSTHNGIRIIVGLDCERRRNLQDRRKLGTLRLCVNNKCLILQLNHLDRIPKTLRRFFKDPNVLCVGVEVDEVTSAMKTDYGIKCSNSAEALMLPTRTYRSSIVAMCGVGGKPGLKTLVRYIEGLEIEKPMFVEAGDWDVKVLTMEQIRYACLDAYATFRIARTLLLSNN